MGKEYNFSILKNYPEERGFTITRQKEKTLMEQLSEILKAR